MNKSILVIEDENSLLKMMQCTLEKSGYRVFIASNGREGLAITDENHLDLILTDVLMPEMDGYEFYKKIRNMEKLANIPVIVFSGFTYLKNDFENLGVNNFLPKPFDAPTMLSKINSVLSDQKKTVPQKESKIFIQNKGGNEIL